ncbi:dysbindin-like isoform X1 [Sinocyclocheilus grahami]|uniref:dysbindin-like isoform X1 n=1 Tax=Sinocyclocheilus grahami TaxID=75366 RepID=UPI0007AC91CF|nr:PREDICTED: dysbindin-like isoform X1 [Sinocyclocheilus grahami]
MACAVNEQQHSGTPTARLLVRLGSRFGMSSPGTASDSKRNSSEMEHAQRVPEAEPVQPQVKLKDRQKFFEEAFQQDMEHYLSTGYLQIAERRETIGSMSSMEVNVDMLEQMDLMDMSDHEALDVFLNSGGEDNSVASPLLGPDVESFTSEIALQVPTQADLRHKLASLSSTCTDSASQDTEAGEEEDDDDDADDERGPAAIRGSPLVQPDQEEVEADATLPEREQNQPMKNCESSSSS